MHDTAFHIGTLAMNIYADLRTDSVLEIGAQAVNGSLRDNALASTRYVGLDIQEGPGVDLIVEPGKPFPVDECSFDLVIASSVFEHDPCFWMTFLEMCRATKDGGYIYINAPSNGYVHRYPEDHWRFYPDSGKALAHWASSQGTPVTLVESFIANRQTDIWNDFVAVFRKGPINRLLPKVFMHQHVSCTDVWTWTSREVINPSELPEDMLLQRRSDERAFRAHEELDALAKENQLLRARVEEAEAERDRQRMYAQGFKDDLDFRQSELSQRQEELEQVRSELARAHLEIQIHERERADFLRSSEPLQMELEVLRSKLVRAETALERLRHEKKDARARLHERFTELAALSNLLIEKEQEERRSHEQFRWLQEVGSILIDDLISAKGRLRGFLPVSFQQKRNHELLKRKGLFDAEAYLAAHPDVAEDRSDPLRHYLVHGISEDRPRA